jgi:hypothetical protein
MPWPYGASLDGGETGILHVLRWPFEEQRLRDGRAAFNYRYDQLRRVNTYQRMALHEAVMGTRHSELDNARKFSHGMTAVLYALNGGASAVVISGINPGSTGHVYNNLGLRRLHSDMDRSILLKLHGRGANIFTADPEVAVSTGLPLWQGNISDQQGMRMVDSRLQSPVPPSAGSRSDPLPLTLVHPSPANCTAPRHRTSATFSTIVRAAAKR